jgi:MinD superfamily P-loop ATPase
VKQLVILSGKGGTGKTSVAAAFAHLAAASTPPLRAVLADADVDAANLELLLQPRVLEEHDFVGGSLAVIDGDRCTGCGVCAEVCRFDAIIAPSPAAGGDGQVYRVDPIACDGCAACVYQCPDQAIQMQPQTVGQWFRSETRFGPLLHAALRPAQENSGKLVTQVKREARLLALVDGYDAMIVDGPPGIGCPVISAASGADLSLVVAEPTAAGVHDMERALQTVAHFRIPALVCINKADLHPDGAAHIEVYCQAHNIEVIGRIPFDSAVAHAIVHAQPVTVHAPESPASRAIVRMWAVVAARLRAGG